METYFTESALFYFLSKTVHLSTLTESELLQYLQSGDVAIYPKEFFTKEEAILNFEEC